MCLLWRISLLSMKPCLKRDMDTSNCIKPPFRSVKVHKPQFLKARPVPYALKEKVEQQLQRLEDKGIIYKVSQSDWAAPVVLVPKKDGSLRMRGDYKMAVNQCADVDQYPLPNTETLFATLAGGQVFSKIDLSHAYQQVELDEDSQKYLTINTHKGLYR